MSSLLLTMPESLFPFAVRAFEPIAPKDLTLVPERTLESLLQTNSEKHFFRYCKAHNMPIPFENYESQSFVLRGEKTRKFTPDFNINGAFFEVTESNYLSNKHWKMNEMALQYPQERVMLVVYRPDKITLRTDYAGKPGDVGRVVAQIPIPVVNGNLAEYVSEFAGLSQPARCQSPGHRG